MNTHKIWENAAIILTDASMSAMDSEEIRQIWTRPRIVKQEFLLVWVLYSVKNWKNAIAALWDILYSAWHIKMP